MGSGHPQRHAALTFEGLVEHPSLQLEHPSLVVGSLRARGWCQPRDENQISVMMALLAGNLPTKERPATGNECAHTALSCLPLPSAAGQSLPAPGTSSYRAEQARGGHVEAKGTRAKRGL